MDKQLPPNFTQHLAYSASAGSGKTFALSVRYISLLFMGESSANILAATFTNKAASEMRQRVVDSLRSLANEGTRDFTEAICVQVGMNRAELLAKQPEVLGRFLANASHIVTLDSFFSSVLRSASLELGLEPDFVTKEQSHDKLETHFLEEVQAEGLLSNLVRLAMDIEDKRFLKIFDLMQNFYKVDPLLPAQEALGLSLGEQEKACEVLRVRLITALTQAGATNRAIKLFEAKNIKELFAKTVFAKETLDGHSWVKKFANEESEMLYVKLKASLVLWAKAKENIVLHNLFKIYDYYKNANIASAKFSGILTFDDLSYFTYRLLHESMSKEFLYFKIDAKFKHILLDEFQDTSTLQFLLLKPLIDEIFAGQGAGEFKSFFYVGDTKQSLYRFRGGVEELFDKVAEHYGVNIEQMDTNYRSAKNVVEQVNRWFEPVMEGYQPQKSRPNAREGYVRVLQIEEAPKAKDTTEEKPPSLIDVAVLEAQKLIKLGVDVDEIAFLVSTNKDGQSLQEACKVQNIATLLKTSSSLKNLPKIASLVAMVSYIFYGEKIDAHALLSKIGDSLEKIDLKGYSVFMSPLQMLDKLVREFGYYDKDANVLKLLSFASAFSDIPTFLEEFETSSIAVASNSVHGAKIMTIHGSKGLEFEYVILLDKLTRKNSDKSALLYAYNDNLYIDKILYRTKGRENFDEEYKSIMEARKISALKDAKNVLYVALTRAIEAMIIIRKPKDSIFDELGMEVMSLGVLEAKISKVGEKEEASLPITLRNYGTQESVTLEEEEEKDYDALFFGTALHYALEMLSSFDTQSLRFTLIALQNRFGQQLSQDNLTEIKKRIEMLIHHQEFLNLLTSSTQSKEQSLSFEGELKQLDLLLEYDTSCMVIEYKSSKKYALKHQNQVRYYRKAIEKITGKKTEGKIVYLLENGVEMVGV